MGTQDISRNVYDSSKNYTSVRQQQGRVLTDDDWNENNRIHDEAERLSLIDIVGAAASPDDGFLISSPQSNANGVDFTINAGRFYLGGHTLSLSDSQRYRLQTDWLQGPNSTKPSRSGYDLVVLEHYQQVVTAVEDSELYEVALGGADTTTRLRNVQRVHLIQGIGTRECATAWNRFLRKVLETNALEADNSLSSDVKLHADFVDSGNSGDLCKPSSIGGYLGAENQTIRVQLRDNQTFTWGFDNAAPLYRVQLDASRTKCTLETPPKDQYHWPQAGQTVEILAWSAALENGEKIAEHEGFLTQVTAGYNSNTGEISLADAVPTDGFDNWENRADAGEVGAGDTHFYMRVWNRGADQDSPAAIPCDVGNAVDLGFTGIQITFSGTQFSSGDYWQIAARPSAPTEVVPWKLTVVPGSSRIGVAKFFAPLAIIDWRDSSTGGAQIFDCRNKFEPLAKMRCCTELVARPGAGWHRIFDRIPDRGDAVICLPIGDYPLSSKVTVRGKGRLRITGAGQSSRITGTSLDTLLLFEDCNRIEMSQLSIKAGNQHLAGIGGALSFKQVGHVEVHHCYVRTRAGKTRDLACLRVDNDFGRHANDQGRVKIYDCEFYVGHLQLGVIIANAAYIDVYRNLLVPSGPHTESLRDHFSNKYFVNDLATNAIVPPIETNRPAISSHQVSVPVGRTSIRRSRTRKSETILFLSDPALNNFWKAELEEIRQSLAGFDNDDTSKVHSILSHRVRKVIRELRVGRNTGKLKDWFGVLNGQKAFMNQGIVIAGRRAKNVNIANNEVRGATQGIHVGLSHNTKNKRTKDDADIAKSITIQDNFVRSTVGAGSRIKQHGCFAGNAQKIQVLNNVFELEHLPGMRHLPVSAIRVHGFFGPLLRVVGNFADDAFTRTVTVQLHGRPRKNRVSVVRENFPPDQSKEEE